MPTLPLDHLGPIGTFLTGLAACLTAGLPLAILLRKWLHHAAAITEATTAQIQGLLASQLIEAAAAAHPDSYLTLDVHFKNGLSIAVPMFPFREMMISENIRMAVIDHTSEVTTLTLRCKGYGHLPPHHHASTCEIIEVRSGYVTHLESGRRYGPGETWVIPQGEIHSAYFQNCLLIITHRPALPTASQRPVNLGSVAAYMAGN